MKKRDDEGLTLPSWLAADERRRALARWVAREILPHEESVRSWLAHSRALPSDIDDVIQEAYCRIAMLPSFAHIECPNAYFFAICRNLFVRRLKRGKMEPLATVCEIESLEADARLSPEAVTADRLQCDRLLALMDKLPNQCRDIVRLRKIEGWSQREIAAHFDLTEKAVEKQIWLGVRSLRQSWDEATQRVERRLHIVAMSQKRTK